MAESIQISQLKLKTVLHVQYIVFSYVFNILILGCILKLDLAFTLRYDCTLFGQTLTTLKVLLQKI